MNLFFNELYSFLDVIV